MARRSAHAMRTRTPLDPAVDTYRHPEATNLLRPDVGTQPYFPKSKRKPPTRYRYDSSLSPELAWDGGNAARELGEWLIGLIADPKVSQTFQVFTNSGTPAAKWSRACARSRRPRSCWQPSPAPS